MLWKKKQDDHRGGVLMRLHSMRRDGKRLSDTQLDFYAIDAFNTGFTIDGLTGYLQNPDNELIYDLPECMERQGCRKSAEILSAVRDMLQPRTPCWELSSRVHRMEGEELDALLGLEEKLWQIVNAKEEDWGAVIDRIFAERRRELPRPMKVMTREERRKKLGITRNPFSGEEY